MRAVLFDFDGTLADTAADLGHAANRVREAHGLPPLPVEQYRPYASAGARGLLGHGFGVTPASPGFSALRDRFLDEYDARLCVDTRVFPGVPELLEAIERRGLAWGIVTNKSKRFTGRIVQALGLAAACVVSGDTTPHTKPHPAPLLHAAAAIGLSPALCYYVGDDRRDIEGAHAAGMRSVAVEWGYHGTSDGPPSSWGAEHLVSRPEELIALL